MPTHGQWTHLPTGRRALAMRQAVAVLPYLPSSTEVPCFASSVIQRASHCVSLPPRPAAASSYPKLEIHQDSDAHLTIVNLSVPLPECDPDARESENPIPSHSPGAALALATRVSDADIAKAFVPAVLQHLFPSPTGLAAATAVANRLSHRSPLTFAVTLPPSPYRHLVIGFIFPVVRPCSPDREPQTTPPRPTRAPPPSLFTPPMLAPA
ncbi:hypothetical protein CCHR01_04148 [Colletotrichum chrysophilum]|uniref:Uncharacterized protein n=1 Tax=Colletotrichum chrysophilum TaxID=1836956 RepID=A0AAD9ELZ4_9PEZI|nr:hypothetical protein CCHR01_04148 [Colletotrichum chrysophilum]